jgi:hypothetical protein
LIILIWSSIVFCSLDESWNRSLYFSSARSEKRVIPAIPPASQSNLHINGGKEKPPALGDAGGL